LLPSAINFCFSPPKLLEAVMQKLFSTVLLVLFVLAENALAQTFTLRYTFQNPNPDPDDQFGLAVAVANNKILAGAPRDDAGASDAGTAYVFDGSSGALLLTLANPTPNVNDQFGAAVAAVGNNFLIGAPGANSGAGEAYLFDGGTGALIHTFSNPSGSADDQFGFAVAALGSNVLIGAPFNDTGASNSGAAYLFDGNSGALLRTFTNPTPGSGDQFGRAVAGFGNNVLIGAPFDDNSGRTDTGAAHLFDATTGAFIHTFLNPTAANFDQFGGAVAGVDNSVFVGAAFDDASATNSGFAYRFDATTDALLNSIANPNPATAAQFAFSAFAFGNVLFGAPGANTAAGEAYLFDGTGGLQQTFSNPTPANDELFGRAVAGDGNNIVVGAPSEGTTDDDIGPGAVYLYSSSQPPVADAGTDQTVECTSPAGALVTLDGSASTAADDAQLTYTWRENGGIIAGPTTSPSSQVTFSLGSHTVELTVDDGNGGTDTDEVTINVVDTTPPVFTLQPAIALWPPNHKYFTINLSQCVAAVNDACEGSIAISDVHIVSVSSDEPEDAPDGVCTINDPAHICYNGDGSTTNDIVIANECQSVQLRQERAAGGNGRVYSINLAVSDASGNVATAAFKVSVPHDQGSGAVAVEDVACYTVQGNCASAKVAGNSEKGIDDLITGQSLPAGYAVFQNYPNPFNPETEIRFALPEASHVMIKIFDTLGEAIRTLADKDFPAGTYAVRWNAQNEREQKVPSGLYFYQIITPSFTATKSMILAK
jgi:FG-GAP repeat/K319L-like, PKD domain